MTAGDWAAVEKLNQGKSKRGIVKDRCVASTSHTSASTYVHTYHSAYVHMSMYNIGFKPPARRGTSGWRPSWRRSSRG